MRRTLRFPLGILTGLALGATVLFAQAPQPKAAPAPAVPAADNKPDDARKPQEANEKLYRNLVRKLLELAVKLDKSDRPEDKDRAKTLRAALELAEKAGVDNQFRTLVGGMSGGTKQLGDIDKLIGQDEELSKTLLEMLAILMTDDETNRLKAEIEKLEKFMKETEEIKRKEEILRAMTDSKKGDPAKIAKEQKALADQTKDLAARMAGEKKADVKSGSGAKPLEPKSEAKGEGKPGETASEPKPESAESKSAGKDGEPKAGEPKAGKDGAENKPMPKEGDPKAESKPGDPKEGEAKPGEAKIPPAASKASSPSKGESKPSKGEAGEGKGLPSAPKPGEGASAKGGGPPPSGGSPPPPSASPPNAPQTPGRQQVAEAYPHQKGAEDDLNENKRDPASKKIDKAVEALAKAIEEMKKRLKQLREEELMKLLANLEARCNRMLAMQIEVYENTKAIHAGVVKANNQKTNADIQKSQQQSDKEKEIVAEAEKTLKLLETEGSAVAFANVLMEVKGDMQSVQIRLEKAYVDVDTQGIEENIIAMLKDMVAALKKQQAEAGQPKPPSPPNGGKPPPQKLINQLAELKLIRALQMQVNNRTKSNGVKTEGEQTQDPIIQAELHQLAARQAKLFDMIQKMATQVNE